MKMRNTAIVPRVIWGITANQLSKNVGMTGNTFVCMDPHVSEMKMRVRMGNGRAIAKRHLRANANMRASFVSIIIRRPAPTMGYLVFMKVRATLHFASTTVCV